MLDHKSFEKSLLQATTEVGETQKGKINAMLKPEFIKCDAVDESWEIRFPVEVWMQNRVGQLHGGLAAVLFDFAFAALIRAATGLKFVPTVELNITYFRPVADCDHVVVRSEVTHRGRKVSHVQGEIIFGSKNKKAAAGKGIFYNEDTSSQKSQDDPSRDR